MIDFQDRSRLELGSTRGCLKLVEERVKPDRVSASADRRAPNDDSPTVRKLHQPHVALDLAVRDAYGWSYLDLDRGFHDTPQGRALHARSGGSNRGARPGCSS